MLDIQHKVVYMGLRDLVLSYSDSEWFKAHKENIMFELNHLELHGLDHYLFTLHKKNIHSDNNKGNSNIAYLVGITSKEPTRIVKTIGGTIPDIDVDFQDDKRDLVKNYLRNKFGFDYVADIGTFGESKYKGLFKDLAKVFEIPYEEANNISKLMEENPEARTIDAVKLPAIKHLIETDPRIKQIFDYALKIDGSIRSIGVHASGLAITNKPISEIVPLFESKGNAVTQYDGTTLEKMGILKFDILGLNTLTILGKTLSLIKQRHGINIDLYKINYKDQVVYDFIASGDLLGIFQVEAPGILEFTAKSKPQNILDVSACIALYRPGPMGMKDKKTGRNALELYLERTNNRTKDWKFEIPEFSHIFKDTYGLLVYQEQLMKLSQEMCGFNAIEADELRKAVGKKDRALLLKQKDKFVNGAVGLGWDKNTISELFDSMEEFARYCFNLSHSVCYAYLTYQTSWLKTYYRPEYMASLISTEDKIERKSQYIENARKSGIRVTTPDINKSKMDFIINDSGDSILFGFSSIKGVGEKAALKIIESQPFNSIGDFFIKSHHLKGINKKTIEALVYCGAFDCFGYKKSAILSGFASFLFDYVNNLEFPDVPDQKIISQMIEKEDMYFDNNIPELSFLDILEKEKELLSIYLSASPFEFIYQHGTHPSIKSKTSLSFDVTAKENKYPVNVLCRVEKVTIKNAKGDGREFCFLDCVDEKGTLKNLAVWSDVYEKLKAKIKPNIYIIARVAVKARKNSETLSVSVYDLVDLTEELNESIKKIEYKNSIKLASLVFTGIPSTVKYRSIQTILNSYNSDKGMCKVNVIIDLDGKYRINIGNYRVDKIDVNFLRAFSKVKDVYLTREELE